MKQQQPLFQPACIQQQQQPACKQAAVAVRLWMALLNIMLCFPCSKLCLLRMFGVVEEG
jgi:hypothetical protein